MLIPERSSIGIVSFSINFPGNYKPKFGAKCELAVQDNCHKCKDSVGERRMMREDML